jgi:hypothetical protein
MDDGSMEHSPVLKTESPDNPINSKRSRNSNRKRQEITTEMSQLSTYAWISIYDSTLLQVIYVKIFKQYGRMKTTVQGGRFTPSTISFYHFVKRPDEPDAISTGGFAYRLLF